MTGPITSADLLSRAATDDPRARLRATARQLEGVFINQLLQAMRATVPEGGLVDPSAGEEMLTSMLDEHLSQVAANRFQSSLSEALYRQLSRHLPAQDAAAQRPAALP